jgi:hypothetical protein
MAGPLLWDPPPLLEAISASFLRVPGQLGSLDISAPHLTGVIHP